MSAGDPIIKEEKDEAAVIQSLCSLIESKAAAALNQDPEATFNLGLSGGSLAKFLCQGLPSIQTDWARWRLFFCDERLVGVESSHSTWGLYQSSLVPATPLTAAQFLTVNTSLAPEEAASDYECRLVELTGKKLDMLLLGAGPDGHTCSLFPGHSLLAEPAGGRTVAHITDSPKPPPARVTLTLPVSRNSHLTFLNNLPLSLSGPQLCPVLCLRRCRRIQSGDDEEAAGSRTARET